MNITALRNVFSCLYVFLRNAAWRLEAASSASRNGAICSNRCTFFVRYRTLSCFRANATGQWYVFVSHIRLYSLHPKILDPFRESNFFREHPNCSLEFIGFQNCPLTLQLSKLESDSFGAKVPKTVHHFDCGI